MTHTIIEPDEFSKRSWNEFRDTGLFLLINCILHAFGWAIVMVISDDGNSDRVIQAFPARVGYRGFNEASIKESYANISAYLRANVNKL